MASVTNLEPIIEQFEVSWQLGHSPSISSFLPSQGPGRQVVLWELVQIDLELRIKQGESRRVEDYLEEFSELRSNQNRLAEFVESEFLLRSRREPGLRIVEYQERFPELSLPFLQRSISSETRDLEQHDGLQLKKTLAEGGLGKVWIAHDAELGRDVALKEVKPRFASNADYIRRFEKEAAITGALQHRGVVPVYRRGRHADGRPFYTMRLIKGPTLQEAISAFHNADWQAGSVAKDMESRRLISHLVSVCSTIHYAHEQGYIHRDIKPENIVLPNEGGALVIDWGLAKKIKSEDESSTPEIGASSGELTAIGRALGSPAYMSPEQARGESYEVDERTDVYGIGATLFSLLTNHPPYAGDDSSSILKMVASGENVSPLKVDGSVPKPLDAICRKAMARDKNLRYDSVLGIAKDLELFLAGQPVSCCQESIFERTTRYLRKYRTAMLFAVTLLVLTAVGGMTAAFYARQQQKIAVAAEAEARDAESRVKEAMKILTASFSGDRSIPLEEDNLGRVIDTVKAQVESDAIGDPQLQGMLLTELAAIYINRKGRALEGRRLAAIAVEKLESCLPDDHDLTLAARSAYAGSFATENAREMANAISELAEIYRVQASRNAQSRATLASANNLALLYTRTNRLDDARRVFEEITAHEETLGAGDKNVMQARIQLALISKMEGDTEVAESLYRGIIESMEETGVGGHLEISAKNNLGVLLITKGCMQEGMDLTKEVIQSKRRLYGKDHPTTIIAEGTLATAYYELKDYLKAEECLIDLVQRSTAANGVSHHATVKQINNLVGVLLVSGKAEKALPYARQLLASGKDSPHYWVVIHNYGQILGRTGEWGQAREALEEALKIRLEHFGIKNRHTIKTVAALWTAHLALRDEDSAEALVVRAKRLLNESNAEPSAYLSLESDLGISSRRLRAIEHSVSFLRSAVRRAADIGVSEERSSNLLTELALSLYLNGENEGTLETVRQISEIKNLPHRHPSIREVEVCCLLATGNAQKAVKLAHGLVEEGIESEIEAADLALRRLLHGEALHSGGNIEEAISELAIAADLFDSSGLSHLSGYSRLLIGWLRSEVKDVSILDSVFEDLYSRRNDDIGYLDYFLRRVSHLVVEHHSKSGDAKLLNEAVERKTQLDRELRRCEYGR